MNDLRSRLVYLLAILITAAILLWIVDQPAEGHTNPRALFIDAYGDGLIAGNAALIQQGYYPNIGTWDETRNAFVVLTRECAGWYMVDAAHDIGEPESYCTGIHIHTGQPVLMSEYRHAWDWLTDHWAGPRVSFPAGTQGVERWRPLVERYYPPERVGEALAVMRCESRGDPGALNPSSAAGLMQFIRSTWNRHAPTLGFGDYASGDVYNPEKNLAAAAYLGSLYEAEGGWWWGAWSCKRVL